jgi:hypothetical protein
MTESLDKPFPSNKPHISFSEFSNWHECSWRYKLQYVEGIDTFENSVYTESGKAVHAACERYIKTRKMDEDICIDMLTTAWQKYNFKDLESWKNTCRSMLVEVPAWLDETFQGWECVEAEEMLYENIDHDTQKFKGFIDAIIKIKRGNKTIYWLLDWKTTSWGWRRQKKEDFRIRMQLILYKKYWAQKHNIALKDVRCGFVLLKRTGKQNTRCELISVSVGSKTLEKADKNIRNMLTSVRKGVFIKNKNSCKYCAFKDKHCI